MPELSVRPLCYSNSASPLHPFNRMPFPPFSSSPISSKKIKAQKIKAESKAQKASFGVRHMQGRCGSALRHMRLDIHSANPLVHRHDRVPVEPFFAPPSRSSNRALCQVNHQIGWMKLGLLGGMKLGLLGWMKLGLLGGVWRSSGGKGEGGCHGG